MTDTTSIITEIETRIQWLDQSIATWTAERAELRSRQNFYGSRTRIFAPEILSLIFKCSVRSFHGEISKGKNTHPLLTFGAVSSHWRKAAYSNPQLWTSIKFHLSSPNEAEKIGQLLSLFLEKSAHLPVSLSLRFTLMHGISQHLLHPTVDGLIEDNLSRIQSLELVNPPLKWHCISDALPLLTTYSIRTDFDIPVDDLLLSTSPSLRRLKLHFNDPRSRFELDLACNALTSLNFIGVPIESCIDILLQSPESVKYKCRSPTVIPNIALDRRFSMLSELGSPLVWKKLANFHWGLYNHPANYELLLSIRLPSIQTLGWSTPKGCDEIATEVGDIFLRNLPSTLSTLQLYDDISCSHLQPLVVRENIKHLILVDMASDTLSSILLCQPGKKIFPGLEKLTIRASMRTPIPSFELSAQITRMLVAMFGKQNTRQFCLEIISFPMNWTNETKHILNGLVADGMKLDIIENSQPVCWLDTAQVDFFPAPSSFSPALFSV